MHLLKPGNLVTWRNSTKFFVKDIKVIEDPFKLGNDVYAVEYVCPKHLECYKLLSCVYYNKHGMHPNRNYSFCDVIRIDAYTYPIHIFKD